MAKLSNTPAPAADPTPAEDPAAAPEAQVTASDAQVEVPEAQVPPPVDNDHVAEGAEKFSEPESEVEPAPQEPVAPPTEAPAPLAEGMLQADSGEVFPKPDSFVVTVSPDIGTIEAFALHGIITALGEFPSVKVVIPAPKGA